MFYFRINKLKIFDNKEGRSFLGIFGRDLAQVKLISFVSTDNGSFPDFTDYNKTTDETEQKAIIKSAVATVVSSRILTEIENVKDGHQMTFGDTGFVLYQSKEIPEYFDWQFIAYESDQKSRSNAKMIEDILNDESFDKFSNSLGTVIAKAANPGFTASVEIAKFAVNVIGKVAKQNKDDMIGILMMSLNKTEHYPHGERKRDDVPDLTNNMLIDYSLFGF